MTGAGHKLGSGGRGPRTEARAGTLRPRPHLPAALRPVGGLGAGPEQRVGTGAGERAWKSWRARSEDQNP